MTNPAAKGERFLAVAGDFMSMLDIAEGAEGAPGRGRRGACRRGNCPNWLVRVAALVRSGGAADLPELGKTKNATSEKARRVLGWSPRSSEDAIVATAESLVRLGLLKRPP